ncbi:MAG: non-heme iron oxygenase ferredoxin subunit [Candidatus Eremiobacteraeota bacterium]|nr:non-heme iron oxygenase ferredoxin subunit [Candidatus Eremiobacteraeota bacterium]MBC5827997.1 non-heme iron oxygenase ferredoxin subunit [Candidatus Eremiobacteraeota bacterium]
MPPFIEVARSEDVPQGKVKVVEVDGRRIALCNYDGAVYAIDDVCTHDRGPLGQGELIGRDIECPRHGALFDVTTGQAVRLPAVRPVRTYPVRQLDGAIAVEVEAT